MTFSGNFCLICRFFSDLGRIFSKIGHFYPLGAAQQLVQEHEEETGITMVPLTKMVYVEEKAQYLPLDEVKNGMTIKDISKTELHRNRTLQKSTET